MSAEERGVRQSVVVVLFDTVDGDTIQVGTASLSGPSDDPSDILQRCLHNQPIASDEAVT